MYFKPPAGMSVIVNDLSTTFTRPASYLPHMVGMAVYARDKWDTPMSDVRPVSEDEMQKLTTIAQTATMKLYGRIAAMSRRDRIAAGVQNYMIDWALPYVRLAGVWDKAVAQGWYDWTPVTSECYYPLAQEGRAGELLPRSCHRWHRSRLAAGRLRRRHGHGTGAIQHRGARRPLPRSDAAAPRRATRSSAPGLRTDVLTLTDESLRQESLTPDETDDLIAYGGWNVWDVLGSRATEGESGLIPRQEYETIAAIEQTTSYPGVYELITDAVGVDGVIELAGTARREIGTKANMLHAWAMAHDAVQRARHRARPRASSGRRTAPKCSRARCSSRAGCTAGCGARKARCSPRCVATRRRC